MLQSNAAKCMLQSYTTEYGVHVQFMVLSQCIIAEANMTAFFVDGSSLSNLQV